MSSNLDLFERIVITVIATKSLEKGVIDENLIDQIINDYRMVFKQIHPISDIESAHLKIKLTARYKISMDVGVAVYTEHEDWLQELKTRPGYSQFYWDRYTQYLRNSSKLNEKIIKSLDNVTDEIVNFFGNPTKDNLFQRRGLVIGDVQSGKTSNYIGLCCKAADAGYKVIILLTGTIESLRRQTQRRLDEGFVGFRTVPGVMRNPNKRENLGVGLINASQEPQVLTTCLSDFNIDMANGANIQIEGCPVPTLLVIKKNAFNLNNLITWIQNRMANDQKITAPILLIDDEADNASVNTGGAEVIKRINSQVRTLLNLFDRATYVGVTATPFANVFIRHNSVDEMLGDDLFPRDFIYSLNPPSNYIGVRRLFGSDSSDNEIYFKENNDTEDWLPLRHRIDREVQELPESLKHAIRTFIITTAIRDIEDGENIKSKSMLINVSRYTNIQNQICEKTKNYIDTLKIDIESYGLSEKFIETETGKLLFNNFNELLSENNLKPQKLKWEDLKLSLNKSISTINVMAINQANSVGNLDYNKPKKLIVIGGNSLSRGITLEGLNVSYFYRRPMAYDTLLQMGRWFGYRDGYENLCKIYMSLAAKDDFAKASEISDDLRSEIEEMGSRGLTPRDFGLKVRHHPGLLAITARNKMINAQEITEQISISGQLIETVRLEIKDSESNYQTVENFCNSIKDQFENIEGSESRLIAKSINREIVVDLLNKFKFHNQQYGLTRFSNEESAIINFLRNANPSSKLDHPINFSLWDVCILGGSGSETEFIGNKFKLRIRTMKPTEQDKVVLIGNSRVADKRDDAVGLSNETIELIKKNTPKAFRFARSKEIGRPLLMIHLVEPKVKYMNETIPKKMIALGLSFPMFDDTQETGLVRYKINTVLAEYMGLDDHNDDDGEDINVENGA